MVSVGTKVSGMRDDQHPIWFVKMIWGWRGGERPTRLGDTLSGSPLATNFATVCLASLAFVFGEHPTELFSTAANLRID